MHISSSSPLPIEILYQWFVLYRFSSSPPPTWPMDLLYPWSTYGPIISISVVCPLPLLFIPLLYITFSHPTNLRTHWSSISVVCPLPLLYITSSPPDQWIFYIHGQPTDPLIFYISGLSSTPSLHYILPTWPMDLLYPWSTYGPIDLLYQWSVLYPFSTLHPPHLTNGSSISMVNLWTHWSSISSVLSSSPSLHYILPTWPMDLLYPWSTYGPIDLLYQWSVLYPFSTLHPPHLTNGSSISMVNLRTHWSSISVVCPLPLLYITSSPPDQWIFYIHGQPTDPLIFYISGLSSTPSLHYILPTWPMDLLYPWSTYGPNWSSISVVCPLSLLYITSSPPGQWIFYIHGQPTDPLIFYISGLSSTPSLHYILPTWPMDLLYPWSTYRPIDLLYPVVCPLPLLYITSSPPDQWIFYIHGQPTDPLDLLYQWSVLYPFSTLHPPHLTNGSSISMVNLRTHWSSVSVVCPLPLLYITSSPPDQWIFYIHGQPTDPLIFYISGLSSIPSLHYILPTWPMNHLYPWSTYGSIDLLYQWSVLYPFSTLHPPYLTNGSSISMVNLRTQLIFYYQWSVLYPFSTLHPPYTWPMFCPLLYPPYGQPGQPTDPLIFYISGLSSTPSLHYILPTWPMDFYMMFCPLPLLYITSSLWDLLYPWSTYGPIDLLYQWSVLYPFSTLHPPRLTNGSSISMVNLWTHWSSISVVCPLPLLYITSSPPDQWIFYNHGQPTDPLIFYISGLSSTPSLHYILPTWPMNLLYAWSTYRPIDLLYQWSVLYPFSTLHPPHLTNGSSISMVNLRTHWSSISSGLSSTPSLHYILPTWPMDLLYPWSTYRPIRSSISVVCPLPLLYITSSPPDQWIFYMHGQPTDPLIFCINGLSSTPSLHYILPPDQRIFYIHMDPLIFYISGLSSIPSLHYILPTWPMDLLYPWSTYGSIDLLYQWSVLYPFSTLHPPYLTNGSSISMVNLRIHWSSISVVCPLPLLYITSSPPDLTNGSSISVVCPLPLLYITSSPPTNGSSISMVNLLDTISVVCPLHLLCITSSPPDQWIFYIHGQPFGTHWSSVSVVCPLPILYITSSPPDQWIFYPWSSSLVISGLSSIPSLHYILPTWPMDLLYAWSTYGPIGLLLSVVCPLHLLYITSSLPDQWIFYILVNLRTHWYFYISGLSSTHSLHYILPTWPMDLLYPWSTHGPIGLLYQWSVLYPFSALHPPHLTNGSSM